MLDWVIIVGGIQFEACGAGSICYPAEETGAIARVIERNDFILERDAEPVILALVQRTLPTYIRNYIHHPENSFNQKYTFDELKVSTLELLKLV